MSHQSQVPGLVADYFKCGTQPPFAEYPTIAQTFKPGRGWSTYSGVKRVSLSWLRKLRAEGVTSVALDYQGRVADFTIAEITRHANRPVFGGSLI